MDDQTRDRLFEMVRRKQFKLKALTPGSWEAVSYNLKHAADRLYEIWYQATLDEINRFIEETRSGRFTDGSRTLQGKELEDFRDTQLISVYYLLIGYSIENLLKAILMFDHPEYLKAGERITDIQSHNLIALCERCVIKVEEAESQLLGDLTSYIEWQAKYPVPLGIEKALPKKQKHGTWKHGGEAFKGREAQQNCDALYSRIWQEVERRKIANQSKR
jgi:hypothetical protein